MKRSELEKYIHKKVEIKLFNGDILKGELHKTGEEQFKNEPNLYIPNNCYFLINPQTLQLNRSIVFKCSHVVKLKETEETIG